MPSAAVTCPSGLSGEIRSAKFKEIRAFGEGVRRNTSRALTELLNACWLTTTDPGPYGEKFNWSRALYADRLHAWIQVRILTFGADLDFEFQCDSDFCRDRNPGMQGWGAKLDDLQVTPMPDDARETFAAGNRFETTVAGKRVIYRLLTGELEAAIEDRNRSRKRNDALAMAELLIEVEGVTTSLRDLAAWVDDLDAGDLARLGQQFSDSAGSVALGLEVQCEFCRRIVKVDVPFVENFARLAKKQAARST